jgi:DmsE family decaheme c-type cytochrome
MKKLLVMSFLIGNVWLVSKAAADELPKTPTISAETTATQTVANPEALKRDAFCTKCHNEVKPVLAIYHTKHGVRGDVNAPSCQGCHGESTNHLADKKVSPDVVFKKGSFTMSDVKTQNTSCLACHGKDTKRTHWDGGAHQSNDVACVSCHNLHNEQDRVRDRKTQPEVCFSCHKDQRVLSHKISHHPMGEGKVTCTDCHNPHGSVGPKMLKKNTLNETCFTCHAEKRGPFLWEHLPVTENCNNCHNPHGSNVAPLLKNRAPFLCQSCHDGPHNSATPRGPNNAGTQGGLSGLPSENNVGRACMNCHVMVHGSNHPAGALLHR